MIRVGGTLVTVTSTLGILYTFAGMILLADNLTQTFDFNEASPQYTLTCISTGGPATTVTWTRDSVILTGDDTNSVLENLTSATYVHTLTVTGRRGGCYACTVANNISSASTTGFYIPGRYSMQPFIRALSSIIYTVAQTTYQSPPFLLHQLWLVPL